jgi:hypothetical protein
VARLDEFWMSLGCTLNITKENMVLRLGSHSVNRTGKTTHEPDILELRHSESNMSLLRRMCKAASGILKH